MLQGYCEIQFQCFKPMWVVIDAISPAFHSSSPRPLIPSSGKFKFLSDPRCGLTRKTYSRCCKQISNFAGRKPLRRSLIWTRIPKHLSGHPDDNSKTFSLAKTYQLLFHYSLSYLHLSWWTRLNLMLVRLVHHFRRCSFELVFLWTCWSAVLSPFFSCKKYNLLISLILTFIDMIFAAENLNFRTTV